MSNIDAIKVEKLRHTYAKSGRLQKLKQTYSPKYPQIKNFNTPTLWDILNIPLKNIKETNPMMFDKLQIVSKHIISKGKILNIGFGSANLEGMVLTKNKNLDWVGIDFSKKSVKQAKKRFKSAEFKLGNAANLKFKNNTFDQIIMLDVLEHIPPTETFTCLNEIKRVLKPTGQLILSVPLNEGLEQMLTRNYNPNAHVRIYTSELVKAELQITKFKVVKTKYLSAFGKHYKLKSIINSIFHLRNPNLIILFCDAS